MEQDQSGINNGQPGNRPESTGQQEGQAANRSERQQREPQPDGQPNRSEGRADQLTNRPNRDHNRDRQNNPRPERQPGQQQPRRNQDNQPNGEPRPDNRNQEPRPPREPRPDNRNQEPRPNREPRPDNPNREPRPDNRNQEPRPPREPRPDNRSQEPRPNREARSENRNQEDETQESPLLESQNAEIEKPEGRQPNRPGESRQDRDRQRENDRNRQRNRDNAPRNDRDRPREPRRDDEAGARPSRNSIFGDTDRDDDDRQGTLSPPRPDDTDRPFQDERLIIGITLGDYNGIGPEVILKALQYNQLQRICTPVIYGSMRVLNRYRNLLNLKDWNLNGIQHVGQASHKLTNVITCWNDQQPIPLPQSPAQTSAVAAEALDEVAVDKLLTDDFGTEITPTGESVETSVENDQPVSAQPDVPAPPPPNYEVQPGKVTPEAGMAALACLQRAVEDLQAGKLDALVTAPINKHNIQSDVFKFPGHTEYLTDAFGATDSLMFMVSETLRVGVVTGHVPLGRVRQNISRDKIHQKLALMSQSLKRDFGVRRPKIAVLGLNPHAGENGLLGNEENEMITPLLNDLRNRGHLIYGPFPADGFFGTLAYKKYDAVLAMYHDQGLIPFKTIAFEEGVNFTAGLSIVRTSPDHGTAYDIAGKGIADETSMLQAIYTACDAARNRKEAAELEANALKK